MSKLRVFLVAQMVKHLPTMRETWVQSLGWEDLLEKEMATHSSILAWKIPWMESLVDYSTWGCKESDMTERLHFHFKKICISFITEDSDCSHEIKRCLLLERKAMTNVDSILKSRDIILPTMVHLVEAMVFPVIMYGCESWTIMKAEH